MEISTKDILTHRKTTRPTILTSANDSEYRKLFQNTWDATKLEGTNNYAQNENLQKLPKICWDEGHKKLRAKQNFQKSPKITKLEGTINTPSEGTNNYAWNRTSKNRQYYARTKLPKFPKHCQVGGDNKYPTKQSTAKWQNNKLGKGVLDILWMPNYWEYQIPT